MFERFDPIFGHLEILLPILPNIAPHLWLMVVERISPEYIHKHYMVNKLLRHNAIKPINRLN